MRTTPWIAAAAVLCAATQTWAQLRVVSYNMLDKPNTTDATITGYVNSVYGAIASRNVNGIAKRPEVIFLSEQTVNSPGNLANMLNSLYGVTSYTAVTPVTPQPQGTQDRIAFVYDASAVSISSDPIALPITSAYPRPTIRAGFRPVGYTGAAADVYVYGMHLRASQGTENEVERANQTLATRANADALPAGSNIIYAGDFNVYNSNEQGYRNLFAAGNGKANDSINQSYLANGNPVTWNNNATYAAIHTQSTRTTTLPDGGATGGVDDRFDFQLVSNALMDGDGISYIGPTAPGTGSAHSYTALGNNGSTFNSNINSASNTVGLPANVLEALYRLSDHLPIVADYQLPAKMSVTAGTIPSEVIQGAAVSFQVAVTNSAPVATPLGADALDYVVSATNTTNSTQTGSIRATQGASTKTLNVNTSTPGSKIVQVNVTSTNEAVVGGSYTQSVPLTVYSPAKPSLDPVVMQTSGTIDLGIVAVGTTLSGSFDVHNLATGSFTAGLDLDAAQSSGSAQFSYAFSPQAGIEAGASAAMGYAFSPTASAIATGELNILTSDVDLPGAAARATLVVSFTARGAFAGDANLSDSVDFDDLLILAQNYSASEATWFLGDFNRDQLVSFDDLLALAQNYGLGDAGLSPSDFAADWALARSLVPEPAALTMLSLTAFIRRRR